MDLLCALSQWPSSVRLLADDFDCSEQCVMDMVVELRDRGFKIRMFDAPQAGKFIHIWQKQEHVEHAYTAALKWWRTHKE